MKWHVEANFRDLSPLISAMRYSGPVDAHGSAAKGRRGRVAALHEAGPFDRAPRAEHARLRCTGQYSSPDVVAELDGSLDSPSYMA